MSLATPWPEFVCIISLMTLVVLAGLLWMETRSIYNIFSFMDWRPSFARFRQDQLNRRQRISDDPCRTWSQYSPGDRFLCHRHCPVSIWTSRELEAGKDVYRQTLLNFFVDVMVTINVFWTIINLFPVLPLDGGQVLRETLGAKRIRLTCIISLMTLVVLAD